MTPQLENARGQNKKLLTVPKAQGRIVAFYWSEGLENCTVASSCPILEPYDS